jgi:6-phosphogluconolactonase
VLALQVVSHYSDTSSAGSVALVDVAADVPAIADVVAHTGGSGAVMFRQDGPHCHQAVFHPRLHDVVYVADLGTDAVYVYRLDGDAGKLVPSPTPLVQLAAGTGPRHVAFNASATMMYVVGELNNTVTAVSISDDGLALTAAHAPVSCLPAVYDASGGVFGGASYAADIHLHSSGTLLFVSNRGFDSVASFRVDGESGALTPLHFAMTGGQSPRNFAVIGDVLIAANQVTKSLTAFDIVPATGELLKWPASVALEQSPVCLAQLQ